MSSGKRVAKRSLLGSRVMALRKDKDGKFHPGIIQGQKGPDLFSVEKFIIKFDNDGHVGTFPSKDIVGPGFQQTHSIKLIPGQIVFVTQNQREIQGTVIRHDFKNHDVIINVSEGEPLLKKIDDIRLIESRKSARLINSDTDFSKLADITIGMEKRKYRDVDIPRSDYVKIAGSRKRRTSDMAVDDEEVMTECTAAMVLMKLSCSPGSWNNMSNDFEYYSSSGASSYRSSTPSPPLSTSASTIDEGIVKDFSVQSPSKVIYQCTYPGCQERRESVNSIEHHVRRLHLNRPDPHYSDVRDHEEEFYYTEIEEEQVGSPFKNGVFNYSFSGSASLVDHLDMARPAHEDPGGTIMMKRNNNLMPLTPSSPHHVTNITPRTRSMTMPITITSSKVSPSKLILISPTERSQTPKATTTTNTVRRGGRDGKKCRKIYGLEQRELWCTQCKWKKACARFGANAIESASANHTKNQVNITGSYGQIQKNTPILFAPSPPPSLSPLNSSLLNGNVEIKPLR
ncbi:zinc finger protein 395 [Lepeophtheirus salmonis]|uniref:zinc finger protein 395 n=1 Tax=Lepeophtheirus salmonis TaxID=72036 RepID=UPI001AE10467|nr:zinc finger protein 395-like [Lepeophtheirus salmonis]XP_040565260.1 zinc finger protein 395-like [Lepeophtheirus salmonis]XP_040565261.1 zinc finger protein 395-like [Lepeophtheirus salmonis]